MRTRKLRLIRLGTAKALTQGAFGTKLEIGMGHQAQA